MDNSFYRAFEEHHRGSRALIKSRLRTYIPLITPLVSRHSSLDPTPPSAMDLGCGRGEWMELLQEVGFEVRGVDLDQGMLNACLEQGLSVQKADALATLQALPDDSMTLISAFHLVEHMRFEDAQAMVSQVLRVLKPGGLLIMETPNPENIVVGASSFYLDPSHVRPLPPGLLSFMVEHAGFARNKIARLQEPKDLHTERPVQLFDVLNHVSPDYAVMAQKQASADRLSVLDLLFDANLGLSLDTLAQRYDQQMEQRFSEFEHRLTQQFETLLAQKEIEHAAVNHHLQAVLQSKSWRITAPLRFVADKFYRIQNSVRKEGVANTVKRCTKHALKRPLLKLSTWIARQPKLKQAAAYVLQYCPNLEQRLRTMMLRAGQALQPTHTSIQLTPRAMHILGELKQAIAIADKHKKKRKN